MPHVLKERLDGVERGKAYPIEGTPLHFTAEHASGRNGGMNFALCYLDDGTQWEVFLHRTGDEVAAGHVHVGSAKAGTMNVMWHVFARRLPC